MSCLSPSKGLKCTIKMISWDEHMEVLDIPYENSSQVCMQDRQYTAGDTEISDKLFSNTFSHWVIHFKSSKIALHRTLNSFSTLFGDLQEDICRFKVTHHCSAPSSLPVLSSSELQRWFSDWTPITVTNFPAVFSRSHLALFPKQCGFCPSPQRHLSTEV